MKRVRYSNLRHLPTEKRDTLNKLVFQKNLKTSLWGEVFWKYLEGINHVFKKGLPLLVPPSTATSPLSINGNVQSERERWGERKVGKRERGENWPCRRRRRRSGGRRDRLRGRHRRAFPLLPASTHYPESVRTSAWTGAWTRRYLWRKSSYWRRKPRLGHRGSRRTSPSGNRSRPSLSGRRTTRRPSATWTPTPSHPLLPPPPPEKRFDNTNPPWPSTKPIFHGLCFLKRNNGKNEIKKNILD